MLEKIQNKMKKKYVVVVGLITAMIILIFVFDLFFGAKAESNVKPYYNGDAVSYNNQVVISSINSGILELFKFSNSSGIVRFAETQSLYKENSIFTSSVLNIENDNLYVYAVDGRYLYKYDASNLSNLVLVNKVKDNSWDWFMQLRKSNNNIITIGSKGAKFWNYNLQITNAYKNKNKNNRIYFSKDNNWLFNVETDYNSKENDFIQIINSNTRKELLTSNIVLDRMGERPVYFDNDFVYIAGDRVLKQINISTKETKNFKHTSKEGYAVDGIIGSDHFYFSDGIGIVKMTHNLEAADWVYTKDLNIAGSWAMGIKTVKLNGVEKLVVFNNSNIAILNSNLDLVAYYESTEENSASREPLTLSIDKNRAPVNSKVSLVGTGFASNEEITLTFGKPKFNIKGRELIKGIELNKIVVTTNKEGRFNKLLVVPEIPVRQKYPYALDIIAEGQTSKLKYSIGFMIE